jgi:hypothetical protein
MDASGGPESGAVVARIGGGDGADDERLTALRRATDLCCDDARLAVLARVVARAGEIRGMFVSAGRPFPVGPALEGAIFIECAAELGVEPLELQCLLDAGGQRRRPGVERLVGALLEVGPPAAGPTRSSA